MRSVFLVVGTVWGCPGGPAKRRWDPTTTATSFKQSSSIAKTTQLAHERGKREIPDACSPPSLPECSWQDSKDFKAGARASVDGTGLPGDVAVTAVRQNY